MKASYGLREIARILEDINSKNQDEKLRLYSIIMAIIARLDSIAESNNVPNYNTYKTEFLLSIEAVCCLDDGNGHSIEQHVSWAIGAIKKLESIHCFNIN
ncbi:MAG: hypothetical protein VB130_08655 [Clostridium sp.]|nr:hypothetical protein [Clostridium sp.]